MKRLFILLSLLLFIIASLVIVHFVNMESNKNIVVNNNMKSTKTVGLDASIGNNEKRIYALIKEGELREETADEIFDMIKDINWTSYNIINDVAAIELLDWIDKNKISKESNLTSLLMATKGLDGATAEKYSATIANIMLQNKRMFFTCLSKLPSENIDTICALAAYGCSYYDTEQIRNDINKMLIKEKLSNKEIIVVKKMINSLNEVSK